MNSPKQEHAKSLGVCNTLVQAILTKKQLFLMFSKPMLWILVCSPWDLTCFSNPNPTSEIWPKLDGSIKKEQESFRSQMSSVLLGAGSDAHHESHECNENQHKKILCRVVQGSSNYHIFKF